MQGSGDGVAPGRCALEVWMPGDAAPRLAAQGRDTPRLTRAPAGSAALGASGGWRVDACLAGGDWRLQARR